MWGRWVWRRELIYSDPNYLRLMSGLENTAGKRFVLHDFFGRLVIAGQQKNMDDRDVLSWEVGYCLDRQGGR